MKMKGVFIYSTTCINFDITLTEKVNHETTDFMIPFTWNVQKETYSKIETENSLGNAKGWEEKKKESDC